MVSKGLREQGVLTTYSRAPGHRFRPRGSPACSRRSTASAWRDRSSSRCGAPRSGALHRSLEQSCPRGSDRGEGRRPHREYPAHPIGSTPAMPPIGTADSPWCRPSTESRDSSSIECSVLAPASGRDDVDDAEEARVLYVALTRARDETLMVERPDASFAVKKRAGRWIAAPWRSDRLLRVEVRVGDIDRAAPFTEDGSSAYIQRHLRTRVSPGDAVILERQELYGHEYVVMHKGLSIASTTSDFAAALDRLGVAPSAISDVYVARVELLRRGSRCVSSCRRRSWRLLARARTERFRQASLSARGAAQMGDEGRPRHRSIRAEDTVAAECSDSSTYLPDAAE